MMVLVLGYRGPLTTVVDRWRMRLAIDTIDHFAGGSLVVSGYDGEASRLARLAPESIDVVLENTARSTRENVGLGPNRELTITLPDGTTMTTGPPHRNAARKRHTRHPRQPATTAVHSPLTMDRVRYMPTARTPAHLSGNER